MIKFTVNYRNPKEKDHRGFGKLYKAGTEAELGKQQEEYLVERKKAVYVVKKEDKNGKPKNISKK